MANTQLLMEEVSVGVDPEFTLSDRLRKAREFAGFKEQRTFAATLGIAQKSVSNYESGKTTPNKLVLREWARITGVRLGWLLGGEWPGEAVRLARHNWPLAPSDLPVTESARTADDRLWPYRINTDSQPNVTPLDRWARVTGDLRDITDDLGRAS